MGWKLGFDSWQARDLSLCHHVHIGSGAHTASIQWIQGGVSFTV